MRQVKFGSLFQFIRNGMNVKQDKSGDGLPITRIETISEAKIDPARVGFAGLTEVDCNGWLLESGDILFSHINSVGHIGKCAVYRGVPKQLVHGMNLLCLRCDQEQLLPEFAKYLIRGPAFRARLSNYINKAVNQASVSIGNLKTISVEIPSLPEQRRIAAILDKADALRAKRREALAQLDRLTQSIFIEMFGDPAANPKAWKVSTLGDVADFYSGNSLPPGEEFDKQQGGFFLMRVSDMNVRGNEKEILKCQFWSAKAGARSATCPSGSIVIPKRGGAIGTNKKRIVRRPTILDPNLMAIAPKAAVVNEAYLYQWFKSFDLSAIISGSSVPQLNKKDLAPLAIHIPDVKIQDEFAEVLRSLEATRSLTVSAENQCEVLFSCLQHRAFHGEL